MMFFRAKNIANAVKVSWKIDNCDNIGKFVTKCVDTMQFVLSPASSTPQIMGSFNSAPKINNEDNQDNKLQLPQNLSRSELLDICSRKKTHPSQLLQRTFEFKVETALSSQLKSLTINDHEPNTDKHTVRVLQWNVLSQALGQSNDSFVMCPEDALSWDARKYNIIKEIIQYEPDVICLQEVDHFNFLSKILATQGYEGVFYPKPDSPCMYIEGNNGPDGCAIFHNKKKFERILTHSRILEVWKVQSNQVAVVAVLRSLETGKEICVATTHLKARSSALLSKLRNEQGKDLLNFLVNKCDQRPVILCGDFNAEPTEPVYKTVLGNKNLELGSAYATFSLQNNMTSANDPETSAANEVPYTTWKVREEGEICHTIDYIFYSKNQLSVNKILKLPTGDDIGQGRVPSYIYPSDHFSLVCDFGLMTS